VNGGDLPTNVRSDLLSTPFVGGILACTVELIKSHFHTNLVSFKIRDTYEAISFNTWKGLIGHMEDSYIPPISSASHMDDSVQKMKSGRWAGRHPHEVFSFARNARISINREPDAYRGYGNRDSEDRKASRAKALATNTRIDIDLESIFPTVALEDGTETSLICDRIDNSVYGDRFIKKRRGFKCTIKNQGNFFDTEWGVAQHVVVGLDAESDDDFLTVFALTTSPSHGWILRQNQEGHPDYSEFDNDRNAILAPEFSDENGELARGKLKFVLVTIKLDILNRLREISRKRRKKISKDVVQHEPELSACANCNAESTIGAKFCQMCGAKLD
jgi:ribosomal protein L40E